MKYLVRTDEEQYWNILYSVEADSGDEAEQIVRITDIEPPYNEDT